MKQHWIVFAILVSVFAVHGQQEFTVSSVPNPRVESGGFLSDPANILAAADRDRINSELKSIEAAQTVEFAVVMLPSIGQEDINDFANRLFAAWGIGKKQNDNGLLLLLVMDQHGWRIETGYGLEGVLPDAVCARLGRDTLVPYFKSQAYGEGVYRLVRSVETIIGNPDYAKEVMAGEVGNRHRVGVWQALGVLLGLFLLASSVIALFFFMTLRGVAGKKKDPYATYKGLLRLWKFVFISIIVFPLPFVFLFIIRHLLKKYRYLPRVSPNGNPMTRLDEQSDDLFLKDGQKTEERIKSVDYDVWVTEDQSEHLILRYDSRWTKYDVCSSCGTKADSCTGSYVKVQATTSSAGLEVDTWRCEQCGVEKNIERIIPQVSSSSSSSSGSSGGGSSFGGGSSGGGGASGKW